MAYIQFKYTLEQGPSSHTTLESKKEHTAGIAATAHIYQSATKQALCSSLKLWVACAIGKMHIRLGKCTVVRIDDSCYQMCTTSKTPWTLQWTWLTFTYQMVDWYNAIQCFSTFSLVPFNSLYPFYKLRMEWKKKKKWSIWPTKNIRKRLFEKQNFWVKSVFNIIASQSEIQM